ncbi:DUF6501 family protein [Barrientosiimonas marina]|uniref:DUF6501 family protein n=1 Tax=Lentibacillus kimchii TaxID=1542911 RepID=A0ABW2V0E5_9BACI
MIHLNWGDSKPLKTIECVHATADKFIVHNKLTPGKQYAVKNETDEFYFIIDNSQRVGGFYKHYFKELE